MVHVRSARIPRERGPGFEHYHKETTHRRSQEGGRHGGRGQGNRRVAPAGARATQLGDGRRMVGRSTPRRIRLAAWWRRFRGGLRRADAPARADGLAHLPQGTPRSGGRGGCVPGDVPGAGPSRRIDPAARLRGELALRRFTTGRRPGTASRRAATRRRATRRRANARGLPARREPGRAGGPDRRDRPPAGAASHGGRALLPGRLDLRRGCAAVGALRGLDPRPAGTSTRPAAPSADRPRHHPPRRAPGRREHRRGTRPGRGLDAVPRLSGRLDDSCGARRPGRRDRRDPGPRRTSFHGHESSPIGRTRPRGCSG